MKKSKVKGRKLKWKKGSHETELKTKERGGREGGLDRVKKKRRRKNNIKEQTRHYE